MTSSHPVRPPTCRIPRLLVAGLLVVSATMGAALGYQLQAFSSSAAASPVDALRSEHRGTAPAPGPDPPQPPGPRAGGPGPARGPERDRLLPGRPPGVAPPVSVDAPDPRVRPQRGVSGEADGVVPDGTTVFDDQTPGVARLTPALLTALRRAATDATKDAVQLYVTSGWRSPQYQQQLLREAVSEYGSEEEAARWVATADTSPHVSGDAVDIGPLAATAWLAKHGAKYGLCRIYGNEPWHYELRPTATKQGCPPMYADPTRDPRMRP